MGVRFPPDSGAIGAAQVAAPRRQLGLFSEFRLIVDGVDVSVPHSVQRVVAFIAIAGRPVARSRVAGELWFDVPDGRALGNLRSALWRLQLVPAQIVRRVDDRLTLEGDVEVDLDDMVQLIGVLAHRSDRVSLARLPELIAARDVLPLWGDEWIIVERERFRQLRLHALERAGEALLEAGDYSMAVQAAMAAVEAEPFCDSARRLLVRVHLSEGNAAAAMRAYQAFRDLLDVELGIEPSESMRRLIAGVTVSSDVVAP